MESKKIATKIMKFEAKLEKSRSDRKEGEAALVNIEEKIKKAVVSGTEKAKQKLMDLKAERAKIKGSIEDSVLLCGECISTIRRLEADRDFALFSEDKAKVSAYALESLEKIKEFTRVEDRLFQLMDELLPSTEISNTAHRVGIRNIHSIIGKNISEAHRWKMWQRFGLAVGDAPAHAYRGDIQETLNDYFQNVLKNAEPDEARPEQERRKVPA